MCVYLLHFSRPISPDSTCQHYLGYADDLAARIQAHRRGNAARLTEVAHQRGIEFEVVRVWQGNRALERKIKDRKYSNRLCPVCNPRPHQINCGRELTRAEIDELLIAF